MTTIPAEIATMILIRTEEIKQKAEAERVQAEAAAAKQREENHAAWIGLYEVVNEALPEIGAYVRIASEDDGPNQYEQIVYFDVPGLAAIMTKFKFTDDAWMQIPSGHHGRYEVQRAEEDYPNEYSSHKEIRWRWWWTINDLGEALRLAMQSKQEYQKLLAEHEEQLAREKQREQEEVQREAQQEVQADDESARGAKERERLFDQLVDDPIVVALMKVYAAVKAERDGYVSRIEELNDNLSSMDERSSSTRRELTQMVDTARREAETARTEATDKGYEVDQLEEKLKKAKRGY